MSKCAIIIVFKLGIDSAITEEALECFRIYGLHVQTFKHMNNSFQIKTWCSRDILEKTAQKHGLLKLSKQSQMEHFRIVDGNNFAGYENKDKFFSSSEETFLLQEAVRDVPLSNSMNRMIHMLYTNESDRVRNSVKTGLLEALQAGSIVTDFFPLHSGNEVDAVWKKNMRHHPFSIQSVHCIQKYYGTKVALYFAWMNHFTLWLIAPAVFGCAVMLQDDMNNGITIMNSPLAPYFTIFIIAWSAAFLQFWKRKSNYLSCKWGALGQEEVSRVRPNFTGEVCVNRAKRLPKLYYPYRYRVCKYFCSFLVTSTMLAGAFSVMIISLNFQGYIHENSFGGKYLHFPIIARFAISGAVFDPNGAGPYPLVLPYVPTVIHSCVILYLNELYRGVSVWLTEWENHEVEDSFENSIIVKRFLFESFDCYIALFYLCFCEVNVRWLRRELVSLYTVDCFRRSLVETIIPFLFQRVEKKQRIKKYKEYELEESISLISSFKHEDLYKEKYDQFEDYMEMVIEFGYVTLFASAFPMASVLSVIANIVEVKSDLFKLCYVKRRPLVVQADNIGIWTSIMKSIIYMSAVTNAFIFGIASEQMLRIFPFLYHSVSTKSHSAAIGMGRWIVVLVFLMEHVFFLLIKAIFVIIPEKPDSIQEEVERRHQVQHDLLTK